MSYTSHAIEKFKNQSGWSYREIARRLGISHVYLRAIVRDGKLMSGDLAFKWLDKLDSPEVMKAHYLDMLVRAREKIAYWKEFEKEVTKHMLTADRLARSKEDENRR